MAVAALVVSLMSLVFCGVTSIVGVILGVIAMRDTKRSGQDGYGLALAGVIIGAIPVVLLVFYIIMFWGWQLLPAYRAIVSVRTF